MPRFGVMPMASGYVPDTFWDEFAPKLSKLILFFGRAVRRTLLFPFSDFLLVNSEHVVALLDCQRLFPVVHSILTLSDKCQRLFVSCHLTKHSHANC